ncbi:MAG: molecular chaperone HtpG [Lentisphaerae bacterium]|jgi:molecular chaperone HtpG|nr:molecular chaperone HtpG [Lentisphaerota bacterium]MBT4823153.1 molecular chaperone HtpG [Lentisphaerota bacterium]MBT5610459.1 molecular chaperone HtpG [Lentisphaerota bacterium]MBT7061050.1 molecular chaperone HtpG [Lentisphaerota bacterium]MBT7842165.1 molecular chaperone HtpG [Lentisphaerota bacterium]
MAVKRRKFKTEVQQLLDLVIHSLYSNKDIFLRELISNASDAIDRARFLSLSDEDVLEDDPDWKVKLYVDKDEMTITVSDNGVGMTAEEVDRNIGTIANSGTRKFLEQLQEQKGSLPPELIGQFGVGFYAAFMVADKVTVVTRTAGPVDEGTRWLSAGAGSYTLEQVTKERRGTDVTLHLKEDMAEYLEEWKIRKIVKQFSDFVEHPVTMDITREETPRDEEGKAIEGAETTISVEEETLNSQKALWQRPKEDVTDEEYNEFYKHISHDFQDPNEVIHWNVEGTTEFRALLYIPQKAPMDFYMPEGRKRGVHLYVKRVFITDDCEDLLPPYLRFVKGVVDSSDLPLNISREMLQEDRLIRLIRRNLVKKVLDTFADMKAKNREKYVEFWEEFGSVLKEGVHIDFENREKLQELILCETTKTDAGAYSALEEYAERMPEEQKAIYYLTGDDRKTLESSPHLEAFRSRDIEVLFLTDPIDEWVVQGITTYKDKPLKSISKGDVDLSEGDEDESKEEREKLEEERKEVVDAVREALGDKLKDVRLSQRLTESACCLVSEEHAMGVHMERIMKAMNQEMPTTKRILELNPTHPLIEKMQELVEADGENPTIKEYAELLHDQALLTAGLPIEDPVAFTRRISDLMASAAK